MKYKFNENQIKDIIELYTHQMISINEISKKYNVDSTVIRSRLIDNGIKLCKGSAYSKNYWLCRGLTEDEVIQKLKTIKPIYKEFWLNKGYSIEESEKKIKMTILNSHEGFIEKYGKDIGELKWEEYKKTQKKNGSLSNTSVSYFLNKGFNMEESIKMLQERQSTFSLNKCKIKYGEEKGLELWKKRQEKWRNSIKRKNIPKESHVSKGVDFLIKKFGNDWKKHYIESLEYNKHINSKGLKFLIENEFNDKDEIFKWVSDNNLSFSFLSAMKKNKFLEILNHKNFLLVNEYLRDKRSKSMIYGKIIYIDGYTFKSIGEYEIYCFLKKNNVDFIYDEPYPKQKNKKFRFDFYLPKYQYYIEYSGLLYENNKKSYTHIFDRYKKTINQKINFCLDQNLNLYFNSNYKEIIKHIDYVINRENSND